MRQLVALLLLVGFIGAYWKFIVLVGAIVWGVPWLWEQGQAAVARYEAAALAERLRCEALCARADLQHAWFMAGDPRGTYGEWPIAR